MHLSPLPTRTGRGTLQHRLMRSNAGLVQASLGSMGRSATRRFVDDGSVMATSTYATNVTRSAGSCASIPVPSKFAFGRARPRGRGVTVTARVATPHPRHPDRPVRPELVQGRFPPTVSAEPTTALSAARPRREWQHRPALNALVRAGAIGKRVREAAFSAEHRLRHCGKIQARGGHLRDRRLG